jgi:Ca2+-binding EF-hand superfamily protein
MSVGSIGGTTFNPQAMASKMASKVMQAADKDGSGTLSKTELTAFKASMGGRGPDVDAVFSTYSKSGTGELTQSELQSSMAAEGAKRKAAGGPPPGGRMPPMGAGASPGETSDTSEVKKSAGAKDLNQDGKVSEAEILVYELTHPDQMKVQTDRSKDQRSRVDFSV